MRHVTIPLMYEDAKIRVLPGDEHNPPLPIPVAENVEFEACDGFGMLVKVTLPEGRSWAKLPRGVFSEEFIRKMTDG